MATSVLSACNLTESINYVFIKENSDVDGSFLISSLIGQRLKQPNSAVVLIATHQTYNHYSSCGMKFGYNLCANLSKNNLHIIEPMKMILSNNAFNLSIIFQNIKNIVDDFIMNGKSYVTIFLDNLQYFTIFGATESEMIKFAHQLSFLNKQYGVLIVLKTNLSDLYAYVATNVEDIADVVIDVEKLKSGMFKEVDGKLIIKKNGQPCKKSILSNFLEKIVLYKSNDRNIRVFAPGEIGLKI